MSSRNLRSFIISTVLVIVIIVALLYFVDLDEVLRQLRQVDRRYVFLASVTLLAGLVSYALRWRKLLEDKPGRLFTFHASNVGHLFNFFLPLRLGEAARIVIMGRRKDITYSEATSSFVLERLFEQVIRLLALVAAIALGAGKAFSNGAIIGGAIFLLLATVGLVWALRSRQEILAAWPRYLARIPRLTEEKARDILREWLDNLSAVAEPRVMLIVLAWSLVNMLFFYGYHAFCLLALNADLSATDIQVLILVTLAAAPPSAPTQPGIYHLAVMGPLLLLGYDEDLLLSYATLMHALHVVWMLPLGIWGLRATGFTLRNLLTESQRSQETASA